ncbi:flagellar assembly peptidoglycan hydrolase FlgJ [Salinisphaera aquimarina]|uniref:Peptidoglycan hydrolase FlgJ n=1 Tax=Salinisphaera aquimarina TaxID=2094031 RepID=A0ABV7ERE3_9GAMM
MAVDASANFALDVQSIAKLKHSARQSPREGLDQAARQFEALFLQKMLSSMRDAMPKSDLMHSHQSDTYDSLMDQQWAQTLAKRGIGLADMMTRQMQRHGTVEGDSEASVAGIEHATPRALSASDPLPAAVSAETADAGDKPIIDTATAHPPLLNVKGYQAATLVALDGTHDARDAASRALLPAHVNDFLDRMGPAARNAARETGVPQRLILAQAALETGWGRHEVTRADGQPSYNVFNIKATGWQGDTAEVMTHEYANGRARAQRASFRAYDSYDDAFADYARLLSRSPRYAGVAKAPDAASAARELQASGYATDPAYADKLVAIMAQLPGAAVGAPALVDMNNAGPLFADVAADDTRLAATDMGIDRHIAERAAALHIDTARGLSAPPTQGDAVARLF